MNKKRKQQIDCNEISQIKSLSLGGFTQKVLFEGKTKDLPILVTLHGGPGTPIPFSVGCRGMFPAFTDQFILVCWDQLGCGINNHVIDEQFTIDSFVQMTLDLIEHIKEMFPLNKLYIFATSWGSILSAKLLEHNKTIADGVVVWGQITKNVFYNDEVYQELANSKLPAKTLSTIQNTNLSAITDQDLKLISTSIKKFTNGYQNKTEKQASVGKIIFGLLTSPDYKFNDFKAMMINGYLKNISLWKEILSLDLTETLANVEIPYVILQGDTDIVASTKQIIDLVEHAGNTNLTYKVIPHAGHLPGAISIDAVLEQLSILK